MDERPDGLRLRLACHAVLFDLDGVLADSKAVVERTWKAWAKQHDVDAEAILAIAHGQRSVDTIRAVAPHLAAEAEAAALDDREATDTEGVEPVAGAPELLASLPRHAVAVVTSANVRLATGRLAAAGLAPPDVMITAEQVTLGKPDPEGYLRAADRLGVDPGRCIVFEDAPIGIQAALHARIPVVAVTTTHPADALAGAVAFVDDLRSVRPILAGGRLLGLTLVASKLR